MSKSLFNKDWRYTEAAIELSSKFDIFFSGIFAEYVEAGYSPREIQSIAHSAVGFAACCQVLDKKDDNA